MALPALSVGRPPDASTPPRSAPGNPDVGSIFERVRARAELVLGPIEVYAHRLLSREPSDEERVEARAAAGALARGLGELQLQALAQLARHTANLIDDASDGIELAGAVEDVRTMLASAIAQLENSPSLSGTVLAIGEPSAFLDATMWVLSNHGHEIVHSEVDLPVLDRSPEVVLATVGNSFDLSAMTTVRAIGEAYACPVILFHDGLAPAEQAELARHCSTMLPSGTPPSVVSEEIMRLRAAIATDLHATVWGFDLAIPTLRAHHYDVTVASSLDDLTAAPYGAIVLGAHLPAATLFTVSRLIRVSTTARRAPVVWQGPLDEASRLGAAQLGVVVVDDFDDAIACALTTELRRAAADVDPTNVRHDTVLNWPAARLLIDRSLIGAQRSGTPNAVAVVRLTEGSGPDRRRQLDDLLVREFRRGDVVGSRSSSDYVIALQGIGRRVALDRLSALAPRLADDVRIGVAEFPDDGRSAEDLAQSADLAIIRTMAGAGPVVVSSAWRSADSRAADVLVVDPDVVLGEMLAAALADGGHRTEVMTDGHEALTRLTSEPAEALPKILMIDLDIGGADGRALLRALGPSGLLAHMKVLAMTSRAAENDIRMAIDLGAADVIRKPFPITLLVHRILRLLAG